MDLQTIEHCALVSMAAVVVLVLFLLARVLVRSLAGSSRSRTEQNEPPLAIIRFVLNHTVALQKEGPESERAQQAIADKLRSLVHARTLDGLAIIEHYLAFSSGQPDGLRNFSKTLDGFDSADSRPYAVFFKALLAIQDDMEANRWHLPSLRPFRGELDGDSQEMFPHGLVPLLDFLRRTAALAVSIEPWSALSELQRSELREKAKRLSGDLSAYRQRGAPPELTVLRKGVDCCLASLEEAPKQPLPPPTQSEPNGCGAVKLDADRIVAIRSEASTGHGVAVACLRFHNDSDEGLDRIIVKGRLLTAGSTNGSAAVEKCLPMLGPGEHQRIEIEFPLTTTQSSEKSVLSLEITYHDRNARSHTTRKQIEVDIASLRDLECPYSNRGAGVIRNFVGRESTMRQLRDLARNRSYRSCVVWGFAGIGKTSLLYQMQESCGTKNEWHRIRAAIINIQVLDYRSEGWETTTLQEVRNRVGAQLGLADRPNTHESKRHDRGGAFLTTNEFLDRVQHHLEEQDEVLLLMLDDYQSLEEMVGQDEQVQAIKRDFLRFLKGIIDNYDRIVLVLSGLSNINQLNAQSRDNIWLETVGKAATTMNIGYLSRDEAVKLIVDPMRTVGFEYAPGVDSDIWQVTNGYPALIQDLCASLYNAVFARIAEGSLSRCIDWTLWRSVRSGFLRTGADTLFNRLWGARWAADPIYVVIGVALSKPSFAGRREIDGHAWTSEEFLEDFLRQSFPGTSAHNIDWRVKDLAHRCLVTQQSVGGENYLRMTVPLMEEWWNQRDLETVMVIAQEERPRT